MPEPNTIESRIQLLVEGNDQRNFFEAFIDHLSLADIQIQNFGGVTDLRPFLSILVKRSGFQGTVQSVGLVRDAENSAQAAFQSVQSSLKNAGLPVPNQPEERTGSNPAVTVLILPGNSRPGMLETLLNETFANTPEEACINAFLECVEDASGMPTQRPHKARAQAYLATKPEPHLSVGVAAKRDYWDLNHPVFNQIRQFLRVL